MALQDKIVEIKRLISLICDVVPQIIAIVRDTIALFKDV